MTDLREDLAGVTSGGHVQTPRPRLARPLATSQDIVKMAQDIAARLADPLTSAAALEAATLVRGS